MDSVQVEATELVVQEEQDRILQGLRRGAWDSILDQAMTESERRYDQDDVLLTVQEIAAMTRLAVRTVERYMAEGEIPGFKVGSSWRCSRTVFRQWVKERSGG